MITLNTKHPIAYESPDHLHPWGTAHDNHASDIFVKELSERKQGPLNLLDLGCAGGQFAIDFNNYHDDYIGVGIEGSDYSVIHKRTNWLTYHNKNLFTGDITKPFVLTQSDKSDPIKFDYITMWEVLEHIPESSLSQLFDNIKTHLKDDGYVIFSASWASDAPNGVELHVTRQRQPWWKEKIESFGFEFKGPEKGPYNYFHYQFEGVLRGRRTTTGFVSSCQLK